MITRVQEVITENPPREVWKRIRYFLDVSTVSDLIRAKQKIAPGQYQSDVKKQARQIGYSIQQAEEYFSASEHVSLPTRPLLLYYGATSLSKALVLLEKDGTHSYDALRAQSRHQHHGLDLSREMLGDSSATSSATKFLNSISCRIYRNSKDQPWGQFPLFYDALSTAVFQYKKNILDDFRGRSHLWSTEVMAGPDKLTLQDISDQKLILLDLVQTLPDLYFTLIDNDISPLLVRGDASMVEERIHTDGPKGSKSLSRISETWDYLINGIDVSAKETLLNFYCSSNPNIKLITDFGQHLHLRLTHDRAHNENFPTLYYPDIVEDISSRLYYVLNPKKFIIEPASHIVILFCLGMVSRYYPDVWMKCTQENIKLAELVDSLLNLTYRKFPNLILDLMTGVKHHIHS